MISPTTPPPKAYSYLRFSTPEQSMGDSFRRQTHLAETYAAEHGLDLDTRSFQDLGVSAYRGKNAMAGGELNTFVRAVEDGVIEEGSYLLVESLDRLSRGVITEATGLFMRIIGLGVIVVTLADRRVYSKEIVDKNPTEFLVSLLTMIRANEESSTKSRRLKAAWANKRATASSKVLTSSVPAWLEVDQSRTTITVIPERAEVVQRMFREYLEGKGKASIAADLNRESVPTFARADYWHTSYITKILTSPTVTGAYTSHTIETVKGKAVRQPGERFEGYYPQVIDQETFSRVQAMMDSPTVVRTKGASPIQNILAGLGLCPCCGGSMIRVQKGARSLPSLVCSKAKAGAGCIYRGVRCDLVEIAMRDALPEIAKALLNSHHPDQAKELANQEAAAMGFETEIENVTEAIAQAGHSPALARKLRGLETSRDEARATAEALRLQLSLTSPSLVRGQAKALAATKADTPLTTVNQLLRETVKGVVIDHRNGFLSIETKTGGMVETMFKWVD